MTAVASSSKYRLIGALLVLVFGLAAATSGLGVRCMMMTASTHCGMCPNQPPVDELYNTGSCPMMAPAAPILAAVERPARSTDSDAILLPAVVLSVLPTPVLSGRVLPARHAAAPGGPPPAPLVLRV